jgi:hypothetical protein
MSTKNKSDGGGQSQPSLNPSSSPSPTSLCAGSKEARRRGPTQPRWRLAPVGAGPYRPVRGESTVSTSDREVLLRRWSARPGSSSSRASSGASPGVSERHQPVDTASSAYLPPPRHNRG